MSGKKGVSEHFKDKTSLCSEEERERMAKEVVKAFLGQDLTFAEAYDVLEKAKTFLFLLPIGRGNR